MSAGWGPVWKAALEYQQRNPDVLRAAMLAPTDFSDAAQAALPFFALFHPSILRTAIVHCDAVVAEFGYGKGVTPARDPERVDTDESEGDGQQQNRAENWEARFRRLEQWHADLEDEVARLREVVAAIGTAAAQAVLPTNTA